LLAVGDALIGQDIDGAMAGISGGERRRVSVGISLVTDARAIFLDEPTTGLDSDSAEQLISLLSHLATHKHRTVCNHAGTCRNLLSLGSVGSKRGFVAPPMQHR
jgi:energy-coupling factor transporter ATP-binding protein EcfA2